VTTNDKAAIAEKKEKGFASLTPEQIKTCEQIAGQSLR
jgi:hypothetical protein